MSQKPYRMFVKVKDGKARQPYDLKKLLLPHVDVIDAKDAVEFFIYAVKEDHLSKVREKLSAAGLEEAPIPEPKDPFPKPYGFVGIPNELMTAVPIWHDGTSTKGRLSGEIRFELETLTPLLVGWERGQVGDTESDWPVPANVAGKQLANKKTVLCPLRAPWGKRPVIIPGDSLKGLLRQELGALLGAPMERVNERSYSYRPNAKFATNARFIPRIARVPDDGIVMKPLEGETEVRVPTKLELLPTNLRYDRVGNLMANYYRFDGHNGATYRGGQGAGKMLNSRRKLHRTLIANPNQPTESVTLSVDVQNGYLTTVRHLVDLDHGHFSKRHPDVPGIVQAEKAREEILSAAKSRVFQPGDLVWVEWDTQKKCIVSLGWHYYYRWAYTDSVRKDADAPNCERRGLFPLEKEREKDGDAPKELSPVRRLFGYTSDNEATAGIGGGDYAQLMGRVFVNSGLEVVDQNDNDEIRFLPPTFLRELGMPRPSAVEHYLKQPYHPQSRPSDKATLMTYGDAKGYDAPGDLAGRKFYLDRENVTAEDSSQGNRDNERSTVALEASKPGRKYRFTIRFRDLDSCELAAILIALCPNQFKEILSGAHNGGYCSKLGYARPLGWGSVSIEAKQLLSLDELGEKPMLNPVADLKGWVSGNHRKASAQNEWLAIHRRNHPNGADYPRADHNGNSNIYTFHTNLRSEHSKNRRFTGH
jgi:CRISPR-associated protein (TIGR03986 family)